MAKLLFPVASLPIGNILTMDGQPIGEVVQRLREGRKLSISEVARRGGMAPSTLQRLETGERPDPSLSTLRKVARGLRVPISEIVRYLDEDLRSLPPTPEEKLYERIDALPSMVVESVAEYLDGKPKHKRRRGGG